MTEWGTSTKYWLVPNCLCPNTSFYSKHQQRGDDSYCLLASFVPTQSVTLTTPFSIGVFYCLIVLLLGLRTQSDVFDYLAESHLTHLSRMNQTLMWYPMKSWMVPLELCRSSNTRRCLRGLSRGWTRWSRGEWSKLGKMERVAFPNLSFLNLLINTESIHHSTFFNFYISDFS